MPSAQKAIRYVVFHPDVGRIKKWRFHRQGSGDVAVIRLAEVGLALTALPLDGTGLQWLGLSDPFQRFVKRDFILAAFSLASGFYKATRLVAALLFSLRWLAHQAYSLEDICPEGKWWKTRELTAFPCRRGYAKLPQALVFAADHR